MTSAHDHAERRRRLETLIGQIVIADVNVEIELRSAISSLAAPFPGPFIVPPLNFAAMVDKGRKLIKRRSDIPDEWRKLMHEAVDAAEAAHERRNRATHDRLLPRTDGESGWQQAQYLPGGFMPEMRDVDLDEFESTLEAVKRARGRVGGVWMIAGAYTARAEPGHHERTLVTGSFDVVAGGLKPWSRSGRQQ